MCAYIVVASFILFDIITGFIKAFYHKKINSTALRKGLFHKLSEIIAVAGCWLFEFGAKYLNINIDLPLVASVSAYISIMELISILENLSEVNPSLEKLFKPYLEKLKKRSDDNGQ